MKKSIHILLVEDNEGDIILAKEALKDARIITRVSVVRNGDEALSFLHKHGHYVGVEVPDLVLLDINMPKINGMEVLKRIKNDSNLKSIPIVMLTTSSLETDIKQAYENHANCYITKPVDVDQFMDVVHKIEDFWILIAKLPPKEN